MQAGNGADSRECPEYAEPTELDDQQIGQTGEIGQNGQSRATGPDGQSAGTVEQVRRDAELFRGVFRNMNAGVMVLRPVHAHGDDCADFTLLDINPAGERLSRLTRAEYIGSLLSGLLPAPVVATLREALARAWRSGIAEHLPSFLYSDKIRGCWRHYFISRADSGDLLLIYEDVTERYMALANLAAGEEKYRALVENTPDIVMRFGGDLRLTYVNAAVAPYLGPPDALMGREVAELGLAPQVAEFWARQLRGVLESGSPVQTDYVFHGPAGRVLFDWRLVPERGVDGSVASVLSLMRDVTRQRSTEHDFRTLFRKLITSFAVHEVVLDDGGRPVDFRFLTVNPAFESMAGHRAEDVLGRTASELFGPQDPSWVAALGRVALTGEPLHTERYSRNMGKWLEMAVYRVRERQFAIIAADITERRNARRERRLGAARLSALHRLSRMDAAPERSIMRFALEQAVRLTGSELGYLALVDQLRARIPEIVLTSDVIVGFPGETQEDFEETMDVVRRVGFDSAFTFIYSKRTGTPAAAMEDQAPEDVVKERFDRLLKEVQDISAKVCCRDEHTVQEVLVEEVNDHSPGLMTGRLSNNTVVHFPGDASLIGKLVPVYLEESRGFYYMGKQADRPL